MFRKLLKTEEVEIADRTFAVRYYEARTLRGLRRYSSEIILSAADRIILDDDSILSLESKVARLLPATLYSRMLAARPAA